MGVGGDRDKATVSHTPGHGPTQATEEDGSKKSHCSPRHRQQDHDHPGKETKAGGPEMLCREKEEKRGERGGGKDMKEQKS